MIQIKTQLRFIFLSILFWLFTSHLSASDADFFQMDIDSPSPDSLMKCGEEYFLAEEYNQAIVYFEKALEISQENADEKAYLQALLKIGFSHYRLAEYPVSKGLFLKALGQKNVSASDSSYIFEKLGYIDFHLGNYENAYSYYSLAITYSSLKAYDKALVLHHKALAIREKLGDKEELILSLSEMGDVYRQKGEYQKAISILEKAIIKANELHIKPLFQTLYFKLSKVYLETGDAEKAYYYLEQYNQTKDSILNEKTIQNIANLKATVAINKKENELQLIQARQEVELLKQEKKIHILYKSFAVFGLLFFAILAFVVYKRYAGQRRYNRVLKEKNNQIQLQIRQLSEANKDLEQFAYISSHDLKSPLRMIGSFTGLLERKIKKDLDKESKEYMQFVVSGVQQMNILLDDIMNYSRINTKEYQFSEVDLNKTMEIVLFNLRQSKEDKGALIHYPSLPLVYGIPSQFNQLFKNLLENAIKFVPPGRKPEINIHVKDYTHHYQFSIQDNGIGIDPAYQPSIFTLFKRLNLNSDYEGTGIGLAICKKIVELQQGNIWVESDGKNGSTFYFTLPKHQKASPS